jgi:hypothetical protein
VFVTRSNSVRCDLEDSGLKIDIRPVQPKYLTLAETQRECNGPSCSAPAFPSRTENAPNFRDGVGLKLRGFDFWPFREGRHVLRNLPPPYSLAERCADRAMHLMSGRWPGSGRDHPSIQSLEVFRSQTVEAVFSDTGNQMNSDSNPVGVIAALPDCRSSDVLEPMLKPAGDGPPNAG